MAADTHHPMASSSGITPAPTAEEAAAIVAAVEALWPKPGGFEQPDTDRSHNWRFSGRWWKSGRFSEAQRPWR